MAKKPAKKKASKTKEVVYDSFRTEPIRQIIRPVDGIVNVPVDGVFPAFRMTVKGKRKTESFTLAVVGRR